MRGRHHTSTFSNVGDITEAGHFYYGVNKLNVTAKTQWLLVLTEYKGKVLVILLKT